MIVLDYENNSNKFLPKYFKHNCLIFFEIIRPHVLCFDELHPIHCGHHKLKFRTLTCIWPFFKLHFYICVGDGVTCRSHKWPGSNPIGEVSWLVFAADQSQSERFSRNRESNFRESLGCFGGTVVTNKGEIFVDSFCLLPFFWREEKALGEPEVYKVSM